MATRSSHLLALSVVCVAAELLPGPATAFTTTGTILVSVTIPKSCTISAGNLAFGAYTGAVVNATTSLTVTCTSTIAYQIGADNGLSSAWIGTYTKYMLSPSGNKLRYHLYTDAARTIEWGTTAGSNEVAGTGTGAAQTIPVYGTIGAGAYGAVSGAYTDTITFTLSY